MTLRFLEPGSAVRALQWMTAVDQYLGPVRRQGRWWVRWVRIDPLAAPPGLVVALTEDPLACPEDFLDLSEWPALSDGLLPPVTFVVTSEAQEPVGVTAGSVEGAAVARAEHDLGARPDRWVNPAVGGWRELCLMRGHE